MSRAVTLLVVGVIVGAVTGMLAVIGWAGAMIAAEHDP